MKDTYKAIIVIGTIFMVIGGLLLSFAAFANYQTTKERAINQCNTGEYAIKNMSDWVHPAPVESWEWEWFGTHPKEVVCT
jgi:hypothetical protein